MDADRLYLNNNFDKVNVKGRTNRIEYIDSIKGLAILLMIFGHMEFHNLNWFIYSFHMPLFFILSGFFFNVEKPIAPRVKKLGTPYFITAFAIIMFEILRQCLNYYTSSDKYSPIEIGKVIAAALFGCAKPVGIGNYLIPGIGPIWFLMALALGYYILWVLYKSENLFKLKHLAIIGCVVLAVMGWGISIIRGQVPFSANQAFIVPLFLVFGSKIKRMITRQSINWYVIIAAMTLWGIELYFQKNVQYMSMTQMSSIYFPIYILGAISCSYIIIALFKIINTKFRLSFLSTLGTATLLILCIHSIDLVCIEPYLKTLLAEDSNGIKLSIIVIYKLVLYIGLLIYIIFSNRQTAFAKRLFETS